MTDFLWVDLETYSEVSIKRGTDLYSRAASIILFAYALNDEPVKVWDCTEEPNIPEDLARYLADESVLLFAHNAAFEQAVLKHNGYTLTPTRWRCTMAQALAHSLPGALEKLCDIFGIGEDQAKLKDGKELVRFFCCPQKFKHTLVREDYASVKEFRAAVAAAKEAWNGRATRETHPEKWARFVHYCGNDVEAMRVVAKKMPKWNYAGASETARRETALWHLDQKINSRGIPVDVDLVNGAIVAADRAKASLAEEAQELTDGGIQATTQRNALLALLNDHYDLDLPDLRGATVERLLKSGADLPAVVEDLLRNRLAASSTSVAKYEAFAKLTGPDGYLRNTLQFCGAMRTARWAGRGVQPQNFPRPVLKHKQILAGIEAIKGDCADLLFDNVMELLSSSVRGCIIAPPKHKLAVADLSNIEGRMLAWLAGENWKIQAFRDFDTCLGEDGNWYTGDQIRDSVLAGRAIPLKLDKKGEPTRKGHDLYALAYAKAFRITPEAVMENKKSGDGSMRQIGKVMELALGYEGGVGAFVTFAMAYGIDLDDMAVVAFPAIPPAVVEQAKKAYKWAADKNRHFGMDELTYVVCDSFKRLWRMAHPEVAGFWKELETAFRNAILCPEKVFTARRIQVVKSGSWVRMVLPSGRSLCYPAGRLDGEDEKISYMGINQFSRQWTRLRTYSGKLCIAADTPVLTARGWVPIQTVTGRDRVWDGEQWATCGGLVPKGRAEVIKVFGGFMTPDHEVLTVEGWRSASQSEGYNRASCRVPDGYKVPWIEWQTVGLAGSLRLRYRKGSGPVGFCQAEKAGDSGVLRVYAEGNHISEEHDAWNVQPSGFCGLAVYGGQVHATHTPSVEKLRRAWNYGVRKLASKFLGVLGGYGSDIRQRADVGPHRQFFRVLQGELPMGYSQGAGPEHSEVVTTGNEMGASYAPRDSGAFRGEAINHLLPSSERGFVGSVGGTTRHRAEVFDLLNCGPRNRFVIATEGGLPLIVHNCENVTQAASRDVIADRLPGIELAGYEIATTVHDEDITVAPDTDEYSADYLAAMMALNPSWADGLPLAAAGFEDYRYRKD